MFLLFRRQKSLALNTTDEIPGDNDFENYCRLKVVGTFPVRALDTVIVFRQEELETDFEII